ncbi:hypothetical protein RJE46_05215 [Cedecea neteri]|uniref:hypothetical protein n=1 Tax=Cedecea neteri TaxID=158822 RepID=UPI00289319B1|nr:hypothetical protein [Cedecea neteri]WNJ80640.1 hypothetical protein RJE46_05215 [Cedecea neteri]
MSASTQLVPYVPIPDFFYQEDLSSRINAAFGELDKTLKKGKEEAAKVDFEKFTKSFENFSSQVLSPLAKAGTWFEKRLSGIEKDAQSAQSLNADLETYKALQYGASQSGADIGALQKSIKNVSEYVNGDSLHESLLKSLGVKTHDDAGLKRDNADIFAQVARSLGAVNRDSADFYALNLGIDDDTLHAMQRGLGQFAEEYQDLSLRVGGSAEQSADQSEKFMQSWRKVGSVFDLLAAKSGGDLAEKLAEPVERLAEKMLVKAPQIERVLDKIGAVVEQFADIFVDALSGTIDWVTDVMAWWDRLDEGSQGLIGGLAGLTAAWLVLNSAFLASPVGIILSLAAAIGLLYNDYQKWKAGEESFVDWGEWGPVIENVVGGFRLIGQVINVAVSAVGGWETVFRALATYTAISWVTKMITAIGTVIQALRQLMGISAKAVPRSIIGRLGGVGAAAVMLEPIIDKGLNSVFGSYDYFQRIRTAPTFKDLGLALFGKGDAHWQDGKWVDNRLNNNEAQGKIKPSVDLGSYNPSSLLNNLSHPGIESLLLSGFGNDPGWRYATPSELGSNNVSNVSSPIINHKVDIVVNGAGDPVAVANEIALRQTSAYSLATQMNMVGVT